MATTNFGPNEIIVLLGAGASVEADIPDSNEMVQKIGRLVSENGSWRQFKELYYYVRSSVLYSEGLKGTFGEDVRFDIERLVNVLNELQQKEGHTLYPFVGAWHPKLQDVAGRQFENIGMFRKEIMRTLRSQWIALAEKERASYYKGLLKFQKEYEFPLRVFSLNYDLCVEETCDYENVQRGFIAGEREWDWRSFDETSDDPAPLMLYKLHGSADWYFNDDDRVAYSDSPSTITDETVAIIFGTSYKLQYIDPFLYLAYELRRWSLDAARVIVCIGYGFNDDHINGILAQALRHNSNRKLLVVTGSGDACGRKTRIVKRLKVQEAQIEVRDIGAREFLKNGLTISNLAKLFPIESGLIPEISDTADAADGMTSKA